MPVPRTRQIALSSSGGAFVTVVAAGVPRSIEFMEDEANSTQGLQVTSLEDNFATINTFSFGSEPLQIPNVGRYPMNGPLLGMPAQGQAGAFNFRAADTLITARSNGGAGTTLRFIEND
jgi:hypothetical protein